MTEHSIKELERQYRAAKDKAYQANKEARRAHERLSDAKLTATGLHGHKVSFVRGRWKKPDEEIFFVVDRLDSIGYPEGYIVKKDGTIGARRVRPYNASLTDHGPYEGEP